MKAHRPLALGTVALALLVATVSCTKKMRLNGGVLALAETSLLHVYDVIPTAEGFAVLGFSAATEQTSAEVLARLNARGELLSSTQLEGYNHGLGFFGLGADFPMMTFLITETDASTAYGRYRLEGQTPMLDAKTATGWIDGTPVVGALRVDSTASLWLAGLRYSDTGQFDVIVRDTSKPTPVFNFSTTDSMVATVSGGRLAQSNGNIYLVYSVSSLAPSSTTEFENRTFIATLVPNATTPPMAEQVHEATSSATISLDGFWAAGNALYYLATGATGPYVRKLSADTLDPISSFAANGTLDPQASLTIAGSATHFSAHQADIDAQGRIVVCGMVKEGDVGKSRLAVWRYLASGAPDLTFGGTQLPYRIASDSPAHCVRVRATPGSAIVLFDEVADEEGSPAVWKFTSVATP